MGGLSKEWRQLRCGWVLVELMFVWITIICIYESGSWRDPMNRIGPAIIGTIIFIGLVRLTSNAFKGIQVLDVVGSTALSLGIAIYVLYLIKTRAR